MAEPAAAQAMGDQEQAESVEVRHNFLPLRQRATTSRLNMVDFTVKGLAVVQEKRGFENFNKACDASADEARQLALERRQGTRASKASKRKAIFSTDLEEDASLPVDILGGHQAEIVAKYKQLPPTQDPPSYMGYGPKGGVGAVVVDDLGRPYRLGQGVWQLVNEQSEDGLAAEDAKQQAQKQATTEGTRAKRIIVNKGRHGAAYLTKATVLKFRINPDPQLGGSRQAMVRRLSCCLLARARHSCLRWTELPARAGRRPYSTGGSPTTWYLSTTGTSAATTRSGRSASGRTWSDITSGYPSHSQAIPTSIPVTQTASC